MACIAHIFFLKYHFEITWLLFCVRTRVSPYISASYSVQLNRIISRPAMCHQLNNIDEVLQCTDIFEITFHPLQRNDSICAQRALWTWRSKISPYEGHPCHLVFGCVSVCLEEDAGACGQNGPMLCLMPGRCSPRRMTCLTNGGFNMMFYRRQTAIYRLAG